MLTLSPGIASSCFDLLGIIERHQLSFADLSQSFGRIGVTNVERAIACSQQLGWIITSEGGVVALSTKGARIHSLQGTTIKLRQAILDYIETAKPTWLQNAPFGRKKVLLYAGKDIAQTFLEAGLIDGTEHDVVSFWDALAARARGLTQDIFLAIGREGERHTLAYEERRTGRVPKWVAIESNEDGYDVLSSLDAEQKAALTIEVKTIKARSGAQIHISRNEWEWALEACNHVFHLWDISVQPPLLAVLKPEAIEPHISKNQGAGVWESVKVPVEVFSDCFDDDF